MNYATFIIDESGSKGHSDIQESKAGELGVMAGYVLPEEHRHSVELDLFNIKNGFSSNAKLHITDLEPAKQQKLREEIFEYFQARQIYWVYEAVYVEGFYSSAVVASSKLIS